MWEYDWCSKAESTLYEFVDFLNTMGKDGWELVNVIQESNSGHLIAFFKRQMRIDDIIARQEKKKA